MTPITKHAKDHPYQLYHTIGGGALHTFIDGKSVRIGQISNTVLLLRHDPDTKEKYYRLSFVVAGGDSSWELLNTRMRQCIQIFQTDGNLEFCLFDVCCDEIPQSQGDWVEYECHPSADGQVGIVRSEYGVLANYSS